MIILLITILQRLVTVANVTNLWLGSDQDFTNTIVSKKAHKYLQNS